MEVQGGYDQDRFISTVSRRLVCSICHQVVREPRLCEEGEHCFCLSCISRHLNGSQTCPVCRKPLTPETLVRPQSYLRETLGELLIKCDYIERGCPEHIQLGNLQDHVSHCGFAPVTCEKCGMQINRKDKDNHEKSFCQLGAAKCQDCENMKEELCQLKAKLAEVKNSHDEIKASLDGIEQHQNVAPAQLNEIMNDHDEYRRSMNENQNELKRKHEEMEEYLKSTIESLKKSKMKRNQLEGNLRSMNETLNESERKRNQLEQSVDEMKQQVEKMMRMFHQPLQGSNSNNNGVHATDPQASANNQDIIILGGFYARGVDEISNTVEKFNIAEGKSIELPPMNYPRARLASCVYNGDVIITGGFNGQESTASIEILKMTQHPLQWVMFGGILPVTLADHSSIIYQNKLYVIGGCKWNKEKTSDIIYEVELVSPYSAKILARMPQVRRNHRAEIVDGKLFMVGGRTTAGYNEAVDSVVVYDFITDEFKPCPSLPKPVCYMSTVTWGNKIIVIGGHDKNGWVLNDVIMYDTETGGSKRLPSLKHKRRGSSAVIIDDVIVVFGGWNPEQGYLNSVESFKMGSDGWEELLGMKEKRFLATAVVIPRI